jgi:hypothetical protein
VCFGFSFGLFFVVTSLLVIFSWLLPELNVSKESVEWPHASGVITSSEVRSGSNDQGDFHHPNVTYDYTVDGKKMSGGRIHFGMPWRSSSEDKARRKADSYPVGKEVQVYYSPESPSECVLELGTAFTTLNYLFIFLMSLCTLFGLVIMFFMLKNGIPKILRARQKKRSGHLLSGATS